MSQALASLAYSIHTQPKLAESLLLATVLVIGFLGLCGVAVGSYVSERNKARYQAARRSYLSAGKRWYR